MEKLFSGPIGLLLVIAQAALFFYLLRGMFDAVGEDSPLFKGWRSGRSRHERPSAHPRRPEAANERPRGWSRVSPIVETFEDLNTGAMSGFVVSGLFAGRRLEDLSRSECLRLCEICRDANDDYGMWFLQSYLNRRFAGAGRTAKPRGRTKGRSAEELSSTATARNARRRADDAGARLCDAGTSRPGRAKPRFIKRTAR